MFCVRTLVGRRIYRMSLRYDVHDTKNPPSVYIFSMWLLYTLLKTTNRGAIFLFDCMNASGCMAWIMRELKLMSGGHPVAEVFVDTTQARYI